MPSELAVKIRSPRGLKEAAVTTYSWIGGSLAGNVQGWVSNPASNFGWFIRGDEVTNGSAQRCNTGENSSNPPRLTIVYESIPEPGAAALQGGASVIFLARRREVSGRTIPWCRAAQGTPIPTLIARAR